MLFAMAIGGLPTAKCKRRRTPKSVLKLPDLEQSRSAVLNSLTSPSSHRTYDHAIREFIEWYCSEPRLALNKTVVEPGIAFPWNNGTMHQPQSTCDWPQFEDWLTRLPIAVSSVQIGLLAFAGRRAPGAWVCLSAIGLPQGKRLLLTADGASLRGKRDYVTLAILLGCGLRRAEPTALRVEDIQQREEHWVIANLVGKGGHIRTIPVPDWVKPGY
jgi:hypothetical protein